MLLISPYDKRRYKLEQYYPFRDAVGNLTQVPKGFISNGASVPRFFWGLVGSPFHPTVVEAAIVHDYLISINYDGEARDKIFFDMLLEKGTTPWKAKLMHTAVKAYRKATR